MLNYDDPDYFNKWLNRDFIKQYFKRCDECQHFELNLSTPQAWDHFDHISAFISTQCNSVSFCRITLINMRSSKNNQIDSNNILSLLILILLLSKNVNKMRIHISFHVHQEVLFHILSMINPQSLFTFISSYGYLELSDKTFNRINEYIDKCTQIKLFYIKTNKIKNDNSIKLYQILNSKDTIEEIFTDDFLLYDERTTDVIFNMILNNERIKILKIIKSKTCFDFEPYEERNRLAMEHEKHVLSWIIRFIREKITLRHFELNGHFYFLLHEEKKHHIDCELFLLNSIFEAIQNNNNIKTISLPAYEIWDHNHHKLLTLCVQTLQKNSKLERIEFRYNNLSYSRDGTLGFYRNLSSQLKPFLERNKHNNIKKENTLFMTILDNIDLSETNKKQRIN